MKSAEDLATATPSYGIKVQLTSVVVAEKNGIIDIMIKANSFKGSKV